MSALLFATIGTIAIFLIAIFLVVFALCVFDGADHADNEDCRTDYNYKPEEWVK